MASGLLARAGFRDVMNVAGGMDAWKAVGLPVEVGRAGAPSASAAGAA
jgi:rhodanese-related sulfurtransferase